MSAEPLRKGETAMNIRPLHDRVDRAPSWKRSRRSPGGIVIPDSAKEKPIQGEVILAVGKGKILEKR